MSEMSVASDAGFRRMERAATPVIVAGALTTVLALAAVFLCERAGVNPMNWYADYVLPIGSLVVGSIAASGFAIVSWRTGFRVGGKMLALVALILIAGYFS